jgi:hypothetical protein
MATTGRCTGNDNSDQLHRRGNILSSYAEARRSMKLLPCQRDNETRLDQTMYAQKGEDPLHRACEALQLVYL